MLEVGSLHRYLSLKCLFVDDFVFLIPPLGCLLLVFTVKHDLSRWCDCLSPECIVPYLIALSSFVPLSCLFLTIRIICFDIDVQVQ